MKRHKICRNLNVIFLFIFAAQYCLSDALASQRSCRDHYLNGQFDDTVLPISAQENDQSIFRVECEFPEYSSQSHLSVVTVIHSGLEQWISLNNSEKHTVGYQIADWQFFRSIVDESSSCLQSLFIRWGTNNDNENGEFVVETMNGVQRSFQRNISDTYVSFNKIEVIHLDGFDQAPIVHVIPGSGAPQIRASPLRCRRPVISRSECIFELFDGGESLLVDLRAAAKGSPKTLSFSFRTDRPNTPLISIHTETGVTIRVDIIDGYLINVNHIIHSIGQLSDGNWHSATIELDIMVLTIDSGPTSISLRTHNSAQGTSGSADSIYEIRVLLAKAQVTAIKIDYVDDEANWICNRKFVTKIRDAAALLNVNTVDRQLGLGRQVCARGETTRSYCNCRAPTSALQTRISQLTTCTIPNGEYALHLRRMPHRFAFVYVPGISVDASLSIVFKSELNNGLLMFGISSANTYSAFSEEERRQSVRLQIHFAGKDIVAMRCSRVDDVERCYSCSIDRPNGFITQDWLRVSLFSYDVYHFMTLNEQICHLSPNSVVSDSSEIYKISSTANNVLFVGGMYYAKHFQLNRRINDTLRHQFQDNTREKPLSFQGCIAELRIDGALQDLSQLAEQQKTIFAKTTEDASSIFAVSRNGTCALNCPRGCNGAPCRIHEKTQSPGYDNYSNVGDEKARLEADMQCDCPAIYRRRTGLSTCQKSKNEFFADMVNNRNHEELDGLSKDSANFEKDPRSTLSINLVPPSNRSILLSSTDRVRLTMFWNDANFNLNSAIGAVRNRILSKIWLLLRFPTVNDGEQALMEIGAIEILVAEFGRKVTINIEEYEIQEVFHLSDAADDRLRLLAIELNFASGSGANHRRSISLRLNADIRTFEGFEHIPFFPTADSVFLTPVLYSASNEDDQADEPNLAKRGCLSEFVMSFKSHDEEIWTPSTKSNSDDLEENYLERIIETTKILGKTSEATDMIHQAQALIFPRCGIRDPTLWFHNSSTWGMVGEYRPIEVKFSSNSGHAMSSMMMTMTLVLFILLLIFCYCYTRIKKEKKRMPCGYRYKANIASNDYNLSEDKRPLKSESFLLDSSRNSSSSPQSIPRENYDTNDFDEKLEIYDPPIRLVTTVPTSNYVILREDKRAPPSSYNEDFIIDQYSSSPKLANRRHRSKAAILLRRPPDPPQQPLRLTPLLSENQSADVGDSPTNSNRLTTLPSAVVLAAIRTAATPSPLSQHNKSSYVSTARLAAPIARQEDEIE